MAGDADKIVVENVNHPGRPTRVDRAKYEATRDALMAALPKAVPGLLQEEMIDATKARLPDALFPGGATAGWWVKLVQLDLEAKGVIVRQKVKPARWLAAG